MSKRQKRVMFYSSPLIVLLVIITLIKLKLDQIENNAQQLAQMGQAAQKLLGEFRTGVEQFDVEKVLSCYDEKYAGDREGFSAEQLQSERDGVRVYKWQPAREKAATKQDMAGEVERYFKTMNKVDEAKLKLDSVERIDGDGDAVIRSFLWLRGTRNTSGGQNTEAFETQVLFRMWLRAESNIWKIYRQEIIRGTTVTGDRTGFTDLWGRSNFYATKADGAASSAGIDFASRFNPNFFTPAWKPKTFEIIKYGPAGVSAIDYDNDGWYDVFFADGARPRLYHNQGDGTFVDVTVEAGLPVDMAGVNVGIFADFDNDGYKDAFFGCFTDRSRVFKNVPADPQQPSRRKFVEVTDSSGIVKKGDGDFVVVASVADYDNDGDLDLYTGRYLDPRKHLPTTLFYTRNGEGNRLFRNDGNFHFTDVTKEAGINETGLTLGVAWGDYDNDNDMDMYVANDFGRDALLRNNGNGTFTDVSKETNAFDPGYGMSSTWGDIDNDGDLDIYISDVHSGQRWYGQAATLHKYLVTSVRQGTILEDFPVYKEIYEHVGADWSTYGDRTVKGNALYLNDGKGRFTDVSEATNTNPFGWYWGSTMFDYDNDGRQDLYASNGWITSKSTQDL
jgi:FG-GAP-like repeat